MSFTQEQWTALAFMVGFGLAYIIGKVLEAIFKEKKLDLGTFTLWTGFAAFICLYWVYTSFSGK